MAAGTAGSDSGWASTNASILDVRGHAPKVPPAPAYGPERVYCNVVIMITASEQKQLDELVSPMIPGGWFEGPPRLTVDDDEVLIVGTLATDGPGDGDPDDFREATRAARMEIADRVQPASDRSVAWGVTSGDTTTVFTSLGVPVMTRLRISEREVLDTLLAAGVARSRSEALAWCVRFVGQKESGWLDELRTSIEHVSRVRAEGPRLR